MKEKPLLDNNYIVSDKILADRGASMSKIIRTVNGYTGPYAALNSTSGQQVACHLSDLYRCAITVGNPNWFSWNLARQQGFLRTFYDSVFEKALLIWSNIEHGSRGLRRHPIFDTYTPDRKRIVSYNVGMAFAKFNSEKILDIRNLVHLETLKKQGVIVFVSQVTGKRNMEPDLIGQTSNGQWHIFEGKGTSYRSNLSGQLEKGKEQARQVASINGQPIVTRSVSATFFGDIVHCKVEDPPGDGDRELEFNYERFIATYYSPFTRFADLDGVSTRRVQIDGLYVEQLSLESRGVRLEIGLSLEVLEAVRNRRPDMFPSLLDSLSRYVERESDSYSIGPDGFVVSAKIDRTRA